MRSKTYPLKYKGKKYGHCEIHPIKHAVRALRVGLLKYKYPICCVLQFCKETLFSVPSAIKRKQEYGLNNPTFQDIGYVPCNSCTKKLMKGVRK